MTYRVYLVDPIGEAASIAKFRTRKEAEDAAEYLMGIRDPIQLREGMTFEAREDDEP